MRRPGYDIDMEKVPRACASYGVAVEIGGWISTGDGAKRHSDFGCMLSINPDALSIGELDHMHWGVEMARKGGVPPDRVLNAMSLPQLMRHRSAGGKRSLALHPSTDLLEGRVWRIFR
jgi:DNA polymerase (family 10)